MAEKQGKPVELIVVPSKNVFYAMAQTAQRLDSARVVAGLSRKMGVQTQARRFGYYWKRLPEKPRRRIELRIIEPDRSEHIFCLTGGESQ
jgi:hypothetical protein